MEKNSEIQARIAAPRANYTRLALHCRASGLKVSPATVESYLQELRKLEAQL